MTLTLACLFLAMVVLGVSFTYEPDEDQILHTMDVILSKKTSVEVPEDADFLAKDNQVGGGNQEDNVRPQNLASATSPTETGLFKEDTPEQQKQKKDAQQEPLLVQQSAEAQVNQSKDAKQKEQRKDDPRETPAQRLARIESELAKKIEQYAKKPRSKYISSSTKAYEYAPYISKWVKQIERTGDLNYPEQAKKKDFKGSVMLSVGIKKDGTIHEIKIIRPSPHGFLNEAAKHIVQLAQPYDPLPETQERVDILYITRTWQFLPGHLLRHK